MLKMTKIKLEPIPDPDIYIFCEKDTRCEISYISNWYSKANKKNLKYYDPKQEWNDILTQTRIIRMVMQCLNFFQKVDSNE